MKIFSLVIPVLLLISCAKEYESCTPGFTNYFDCLVEDIPVDSLEVEYAQFYTYWYYPSIDNYLLHNYKNELINPDSAYFIIDEYNNYKIKFKSKYKLEQKDIDPIDYYDQGKFEMIYDKTENKCLDIYERRLEYIFKSENGFEIHIKDTLWCSKYEIYYPRKYAEEDSFKFVLSYLK